MDFFEHLGHCCGDELDKWGRVCDDSSVHRNRSTILTCGSKELGDLVDSPEMKRFSEAAGIDSLLQTFSPEEAVFLLEKASIRKFIACVLVEETAGAVSVAAFAKQLRKNGSGAIPCVAVARRPCLSAGKPDLQAARQSLLTRFQRRGRYSVNRGLVDSILQIDTEAGSGADFVPEANPEAVARAILTAVRRRVDIIVPHNSF